MIGEDSFNNIKNKLESISQEMFKISEYINTTRYQHDLLKEWDKWNQICSSIWVIDDTILSIREYIDSEYPKTSGLKYVFTYGILQSLFIQQDAVKNLSESFEIPVSFNEKLKEIRDYRNSTIGHPTRQGSKNSLSFNYITRVSLSKSGFTFQKCMNENDRFINVNLIEIIQIQIDEVCSILKQISTELKELDQHHKNRFKGVTLKDILPSTLGYSFEKVSEAINSPGFGNKEFGLSMLNIIEEAYIKFENELLKRNELPGNEYLSYDLNQYKICISKIKSYLSENEKNLDNNDVTYFNFYLREKHKYFLEIAGEIDEEYLNTELK